MREENGAFKENSHFSCNIPLLQQTRVHAQRIRLVTTLQTGTFGVQRHIPFVFLWLLPP